MIQYENLKRVNLEFESDFKKAYTEFVNSGWYILGKNVEAFENEFASSHKSKYCVGVASGLDALILSLKALDLPEGSEVILPSNTYIASIISVVNSNLKPVLVEPELETYNIDINKIEEKISNKTKVILPVHLYGKVSRMVEINAIAQRYNLHVIEDCAQSHDAKINDKYAGTFGDFGAFSFYPTKNLGALGDAGAILTDNEDYYKKLIALRNYGSFKKYFNDYIGLNSRLDEIQASFLRIKLQKLTSITSRKRALAEIYLDNIDQSNFILPKVEDGYLDVYHIFNIRHPLRDKLKEYLLEKGVKTEIHYPVPPHKQVAYKHLFSGSYPISEKIHETTLSLPISYATTIDECLFISEKLNEFQS